MTQRKGFTLVELIVSIVILSLVLGIIWSFFMYNLRLYNMSEANAQVQFQIRQASDHIQNELQFVSAISTTDSTLAHQLDRASLVVDYPLLTDVQFSLEAAATSYLVHIRLTGANDNPNSDYQLETTLTLKNIKNGEIGDSDIIYYQ